MSSTINNVRALQTLAIHTSDVNSVDFAADCILVTGSGDKRVRVWEWQPGSGYVEAQFSPLLGHKYGVTSVKVSPQSTMLASSSIDGTTLLWNMRTGTKVHTMVQVGGEAVRVCRFSPDSTLLVTAGDSGQVCLWDIVRRSLIRCFQKHDGAVQSVAFSPDSGWLLTSCTFGVLKLFSTADIIDSWVSDNRAITTFAAVDDAHDLGVVCCDFSVYQEIAHGEPFTKLYQLVTCGNDHHVKLWEISVAQDKCDNRSCAVRITLRRIMEKHGSALTCVRFSGNGMYIASSSLDKTTVVWETITGKAVAITSAHKRYVACCAFSRDGNLLATGSNDKSVIVWGLNENLSLDSKLARRYTSALAINHHEQTDEYEQGVMRNVENSANEVILIQKLDEHCGAVNSVAFHGTHLMASGSGDRLVRVWSNDVGVEAGAGTEVEFDGDIDAEAGIRADVTKNKVEVQAVKMEENEEVDCGGTVKFREKSFSPLNGHKYSVNHVEFSPCGTMLASCSLDGTAIIWNTESGDQARSSFVNSRSGIRVCRWSPDGSKIATAGDDEKTTLWDVNNMEELRVFDGHSDAVNAIAFTCDSRYLVTACNEGTWRLFDTLEDKYSGALIVCDEAHDLGVQGCDFSPTSDSTMTGREAVVNNARETYLLATSGNDSLVKLWQITICKENDVSSVDVGMGSSGSKTHYKAGRFLTGHGGNVTNVRFSPVHGEILASVATDRTARIWSVFSATCLYVLENHESLVTSCAFSEDTSLFITGALDRSISIWKIPQQLVSQSVMIDNLRRNKKKLAGWKVEDTLNWMNEVGLTAFTKCARTIRLTGRQLLSLTVEELIERLQINVSDELMETFKKQLYWLKREDRNIPDVLDDTETPHEFLCPITHEIMKEPVQCADGFTYERAAINEWFLCGKYTSPMTNESLQDTTFTPNISLRNAIYTFLHGDPTEA